MNHKTWYRYTNAVGGYSWRYPIAAGIIALIVFLAYCNKAGAADFTEVLLDDEGCPFKNEFTTLRTTATVGGPDCPHHRAPDKMDKPDLTLGDVVYISCNYMIPTETPAPGGEEKFKRNELAKRVRRAKDERLSPEEIILVKKLMGLLWSPSIIGVAYPKIDPSLAKK